jgi:hypothetical protein
MSNPKKIGLSASKLKTVIVELLPKIDEIKEENQEANQNWGAVEQKAYKRITEGSDRKNVPGEEILNWLSDLEQQQ